MLAEENQKGICFHPYQVTLCLFFNYTKNRTNVRGMLKEKLEKRTKLINFLL